MSTKTSLGNYFEHFRFGQVIEHSTPRTVSPGDVSLYFALFGSRFAVQTSVEFARQLGLPQVPLEDWLVFNLVFGQTVADISLNAIANLGYALGRFGVPVFCGDTLRATSEIIGLKQNRDGQTGVVYVRSRGVNQREELVLEYCRWVMVRKQDGNSPPPDPVVPDLPTAVSVDELIVPEGLTTSGYDPVLAGSPYFWEDYECGECMDHVDGVTIEESDHMLAARLFQNTARVHLNQHVEREGRFGRRIVYGGHIISLARSLSYNGLGNAVRVLAIHGGRHVSPTFAGDTIYAWSKVLEKTPLRQKPDFGVLRVRTTATKNRRCGDYPYQTADGKYEPEVVLDLDYSVLLPRR